MHWLVLWSSNVEGAPHMLPKVYAEATKQNIIVMSIQFAGQDLVKCLVLAHNSAKLSESS